MARRQPSPSSIISYDRRWLLWHGRIIHEGFKLINGLGEIVLVETFRKPEKKEE